MRIGASNDLREADHGMERRRTLATAGPPSSFLYLHLHPHHFTTCALHLHHDLRPAEQDWALSDEHRLDRRRPTSSRLLPPKQIRATRALSRPTSTTSTGSFEVTTDVVHTLHDAYAYTNRIPHSTSIYIRRSKHHQRVSTPVPRPRGVDRLAHILQRRLFLPLTCSTPPVERKSRVRRIVHNVGRHATSAEREQFGRS